LTYTVISDVQSGCPSCSRTYTDMAHCTLYIISFYRLLQHKRSQIRIPTSFTQMSEEKDKGELCRHSMVYVRQKRLRNC